ncbi:MAG TPA: 50S ribosomal protein L22 [Candidatus Paceibacterota bacterium]
MATQIAQLRFLRMAPRKVRLVADTLKGLSVNEAEAQLLLQPRRAAKPLLKLLRSAVSNAKNNQKLNPDTLMIQSIRVDNGPMLKRSMPRARGSSSPIQKKMSHVFLLLAESASVKPKRFSIVVPKKVKDMQGKKKVVTSKEKTKLPGTIELPRPLQEKPGVFKRFFQRKSV